MNAAEGALLSACEENVTGRSEARPGPFSRVRARPGRRSTLKTAGGRPQAAVDPRRKIIVNVVIVAFIKKRTKQRPSTREKK
jgi:hypothetical protein